jgi:hypothetical protein
MVDQVLLETAALMESLGLRGHQAKPVQLGPLGRKVSQESGDRKVSKVRKAIPARKGSKASAVHKVSAESKDRRASAENKASAGSKDRRVSKGRKVSQGKMVQTASTVRPVL